MVKSDKTAIGIAVEVRNGGVLTVIFEPDEWPIYDGSMFGVRLAVAAAARKCVEDLSPYFLEEHEQKHSPAMCMEAGMYPPFDNTQ